MDGWGGGKGENESGVYTGNAAEGLIGRKEGETPFGRKGASEQEEQTHTPLISEQNFYRQTARKKISQKIVRKRCSWAARRILADSPEKTFADRPKNFNTKRCAFTI